MNRVPIVPNVVFIKYGAITRLTSVAVIYCHREDSLTRLFSTWWVRVRHSKPNTNHAKLCFSIFSIIPVDGSPLCPVASLVLDFACIPHATPTSSAFYSFDS